MSEVNHPTHYNLPVPHASRAALHQLGFTQDEMDSVECIVAMEDAISPDAVFWFCVLSAVKYLWRAGYKQTAEIDYDKTNWCLSYALNMDGVAINDEVRKRISSMRNFLPIHQEIDNGSN